MKRAFFLLIGFLALAACVPQPPPGVAKPTVENADLIFLDLNCGDLCDAIADVTRRQFGVKGPALSHVGILSKEDGRWFVYEAWEGVQRTPLETVLARVQKFPHADDRWRVGHVQGLSNEARERVIAAARTHLGAPYDEDFIRNNGKYYCSELVADSFAEALPGRSFFSYRPMYYGAPKDPEDRAWKIWKGYFAKRHATVPAGQPGLSPLGIYLSGRVAPVDKSLRTFSEP
ncbi:MAG: YiiX/YebB-like N1pC/P60 family cysteine hydrolase [Pseudomonadota bacterium]